jgi:hypothetical protein
LLGADQGQIQKIKYDLPQLFQAEINLEQTKHPAIIPEI